MKKQNWSYCDENWNKYDGLTGERISYEDEGLFEDMNEDVEESPAKKFARRTYVEFEDLLPKADKDYQNGCTTLVRIARLIKDGEIIRFNAPCWAGPTTPEGRRPVRLDRCRNVDPWGPKGW
jgi:hypothetical protein